jgi:16S rRNA (adenine1518-N6/adenine1519-N6)-dimethyltransferase
MLRQSLRGLLPDPLPIIAAAGLDPTARAETVPVEGFVRLAQAWRAMQATPQRAPTSPATKDGSPV